MPQAGVTSLINEREQWQEVVLKGPFAAAHCVCPALPQSWGSDPSTAAAPSGVSENLAVAFNDSRTGC